MIPVVLARYPHSARVYNYWLGGKDNFAADRELGQRTIEAYPNVVLSVRANRKFPARAVRFLARDEGIRQFLDVGTGIPSANNTHEVAQRFAPDARNVYVDNDPIVLLAREPCTVRGGQLPGDLAPGQRHRSGAGGRVHPALQCLRT